LGCFVRKEEFVASGIQKSLFYFKVLKKVMDLVVGVHEKIIQTTKACKGNASKKNFFVMVD
jgi:hypothetical protein